MKKKEKYSRKESKKKKEKKTVRMKIKEIKKIHHVPFRNRVL